MTDRRPALQGPAQRVLPNSRRQIPNYFLYVTHPVQYQQTATPGMKPIRSGFARTAELPTVKGHVSVRTAGGNFNGYSRVHCPDSGECLQGSSTKEEE